MQTEPDHSIGTLPNTLTNDVVVKVIDGSARCTELLVLGCWCPFHLVDLCFVKRMSLLTVFLFFGGLAPFDPSLCCLRWLAGLTLVQL